MMMLLREYLAHSIAEMQSVNRKSLDEFNMGYEQALLDIAKEFFPNEQELWRDPK